MVFSLNVGFLSELSTRWSILVSDQYKPFSEKMYELLSAKIIDWYLVGYRWGALWKLAFDVKL